MKRIVILLALALLVYISTLVYSAPSITYDNTQPLSYIIRYYSSNNSYSSNLATLSSFQLFSNDAKVGDMIYFGFGSRTLGPPALPWHDLYFSISTPLQGVGIQLVWEYWDDSAKAWKPIPSLVDETNKFTQTGWVKFPVPPYWFYGAWFDGLTVNGIYSMWIRVRLANGTVTNGGAVNQQVVCHDNTITVKDYSSVRFSDIYQASVLNNWGVVTKQTGSSVYLISANLRFVNSTLYTSREFIQIGYFDRPASLRSDSMSKLIFGRLTANGVGVDGSEIYIYAKMTYPYITVYNIYLYGSRYVRYGGDYTHNFGGNIDIVDSQLVGDMSVYILPDTNTRLLRVLYSSPVVFRLYSNNATVNYLFLPAYTPGIIAGTNANPVIANVVFLSNQTLTRYGNANVTLLNCIIKPSQIYSTNPFGSDLWVKFLYSFDLRLVDKNGNPVSGATVKLYDTYGSLVFRLTTNSTGQIPTQYVMTYITWWNKSENWSIRHEKSYNPFTLVVSHPDYPPVIMKWNIEQKQDLLLPIDPLDPAELYVNTTRNLYLPKDVVIINAYVLYENARQTGLTINVTVFKPDGTKSQLIQLRDDGVFPDTVAGDGLYAGLFLDTSMPGVYRVNASTIFQSAILRANWTFLVDNTADLVLKVNDSLSSQLSKVNSTILKVNTSLSNQLSQVNNTVLKVNVSLSSQLSRVNSTLHSRIDAVNKSLSAQVTSVNNTVKTCCSEVKDLVRAVNSSLYNKMVSINGSIYGKLVAVNQSLYAEIMAVNDSIQLKLSNIKCNTTTLENMIRDVNVTLHGRLVSVNSTLYMKVDDVQLKLLQVNNTLYNAVIDSKDSIMLKLDTIDTKTSNMLARLGEVNASIHGKIIAVGDKLYLKIDGVEAQVSSQSTKLDQAIQGVNQVSTTVQQVPQKIDQSTSTILDTLSKISSQIRQLQESSPQNVLSIPPWILWLLVAQVIILVGILLAVKRQPSTFTPYFQPTQKTKSVSIVFAIVFLAFAYLLLNRFSELLPIPVPLAFGTITLLTFIAIYLGIKKTLALLVLLGLTAYLAWTQHIEISLPEIPLPIISLATVFIIFTIAFILLRRRKKQQEVMMW